MLADDTHRLFHTNDLDDGSGRHMFQMCSGKKDILYCCLQEQLGHDPLSNNIHMYLPGVLFLQGKCWFKERNVLNIFLQYKHLLLSLSVRT